MGRYGITIKSPDFSHIPGVYDSRCTLEDIDNALIETKATICTNIIKHDVKLNDAKFHVAFLITQLLLRQVILHKSWVDGDKLYLDDVRDDDNKWNVEDTIENYKKFINSDKEELLIYCMCDYEDLFETDNLEYKVNTVRVRLDNFIEDINETLSTYIEYQIANTNWDKKVNEYDEEDNICDDDVDSSSESN